MLVNMQRESALNPLHVTRMALWWGLLTIAILAYLANLIWALSDVAAGVLVLGWSAASAVVAFLFARRRGWARPAQAWIAGRVILLIGLGAGVVYFALAALGPVTNYDSGLYHLGAVSYAADFPAIPGISNLYFALAYGNAEFPLAALLGNGPWQGDGFRLLNGLIMAMAAVELVLRARRRRPSVGFFVLLAGMVATWVPMLALSDYWVTSPSQDSSVLMVTVVASAYIADTVTERRWAAPAATALALSVLLILLRPTMVIFAMTLVLTVIVVAWKRRTQDSGEAVTIPALVIAVAALAAGIAATARDYVLSGWLQYPLSLYAFDVPWRAEDPSMFRNATLGYHRNPEDLWGSVEGWAWAGPWLGSRAQQWETYLIFLLVVAAIAVPALAAFTGARLRWRSMVLAMAPSAVASVFWFLATPPSYRFAWGTLFTVATIPLGFGLRAFVAHGGKGARKAARRAQFVLSAAVVPVVAVVAFSAFARFDWAEVSDERTWKLGVSVPYVVAPIVNAPVRVEQTATGLELLVPTESDQCWANYPMCTPTPNPALKFRGTELGSGFLP